MHAHQDLGFPVASWRQLIRRRICFEGEVALSVGLGVAAVFAAELGGGEFAERDELGTDAGEESGVREGVEGVEEVFGGVAGEKEEVDGGFGVQVVDYDEVVGMRDHSRGRKACGVVDVLD